MILLFLPVCKEMKADKVTRNLLNNGMTVLIMERHSIPVVAINTWVNTGYFNEPDSLIGISHLLEHMFFKGTKKREVGQLRNETKKLGGYLNAGTIYEYTHYFTVLPSQYTESGLELQSDALWNSVIDTAELEKEKKVVIEEVKRKLDNPDALAWEKLVELAFDHHPIRRWRMGTPELIAGWSRNQFEQYYRTFYRPDNIILSVVGDIDTKEVLREIKGYYGNVKMDKTQKPHLQPDPEQKGLKYFQMKGDITQSYLKIGFHIPGRIAKDYGALDVLSQILGKGRSSRLSRKLIEEKQQVHAVRSDAFGLKDLGFLTIEAELSARDMQDARNEIFQELENLKKEKISTAELVKAKNAIRFLYRSSVETAEGVSENLALFESYGDYKLGLEYLDKVEQLTVEDVQKAAMRYLSLENASIIEYRPNGDYDTGLNSTKIGEQIALGLSSSSQMKESAEGKKDEIRLPKSQEKWEPSDSNNLPVKKVVLSCGAGLVTKVNRSVPLVSIGIYFKGGRVNETQENSGITQLVLKGSLKGTATKSGEEIFNQLEMLGATLETETEADYFGYQLKILSENLDEGLGILADVIPNPVFDPDELEKEKKILIAQIEKNKDNMAEYPVELFYRAAFPHHPYGLSSLGDKDAIGSLEREEMIQWHRQNLSVDNMLIVAVGDFDSSRLKLRLEDWFGNFNHTGKKGAMQPRLELEPESNLVVESRSKAQTAQALGFITSPYTDSDLYALKVLQAVASGGGGRFYGELREKRGLAYTVYGVNDSWAKAGVFYSYIATSPENEEPAREELIRQFYRFKTDTVTDEELETAKKYITGMYQIQLETNSALLKQYTKTELLGSGTEEVENYPQRINHVTKDQIKAVAEKYFLPGNLTVGMVKGKK